MSATVVRTADRAARKEHACFWCREPIAVGEAFHEDVVAEDGRLDTWRTHPECRSAERRAIDYHGSYRLSDEPVCCNIDYDGGQHLRGKNCADCSDIPLDDYWNENPAND